MNQMYYMLHNGGPCLPCTPTEAPSLNKKGFGIFWSVHEFNGERKKENITHLTGFAVDIDSGTKEEQLAQIKKGCYPTLLVESKRGYQVYWLFKEPLPVEYSEDLQSRYAHTMNNRLVPFYSADKNAKDLCRILRVPYFVHAKDPLDPFMIIIKEKNPVYYTWDRIDRFYPDVNANKVVEKQKQEFLKNVRTAGSGNFFDRVETLNCKEALQMLSGTAAVSGDVFEFKNNRAGTEQIIVNGKSTACWIDVEGKIGSHDKGGPTIWQWLYWYHLNHKVVYKFLKEII